MQTTGGATDVLGSSAITFNGAATTVAGLFATLPTRAPIPMFPAASLDNGALSFAASEACSIVSVDGRLQLWRGRSCGERSDDVSR